MEPLFPTGINFPAGVNFPQPRPQPQPQPQPQPPQRPQQAQQTQAIEVEGTRGTTGNDSLAGSSGDDTFVGGTGNDTLVGNSGTDTVNYLELDSAISLQARGLVTKGDAGTDLLNGVETVIAPEEQPNTIDASTGVGVASIDVDLASDRLTVNNLPGIGSLTFTVENFADVVGTPNADAITGNVNNNYLEGGAGNDTLTGGGGNDFLVGVNVGGGTPGLNEQDILVGGTGRDIFALGDDEVTYYQGNGFASIRDFTSGIDRIQLNGAPSDYTIAGNTIFLAGTGDRIAVIDGAFNRGDLTFV